MPYHPVEEYIGHATWQFLESKFTPYGKEVLTKVIDFVEEEALPAEETYHAQLPASRWGVIPSIMEDLKAKAKARGLWNLFLSEKHFPKFGCPLTTLEYSVCCEILGRCYSLAPQSMNCSAPDTGNMEVLAKFGSPEQQERWLQPLLDGKIRSCFLATEKDKSSSDATNISATITPDGKEIVINASKHWISSALDPRVAFHIILGKSHPEAARHRQQTMVIVPADTPGIKVGRPLTFFGYDDAPEGHCEVVYENVRVPVENIILGWQRGFEVMQGRMGPARLHLCMRAVGMAERCLDYLLQRATDPSRTVFGKQLHEHGTVISDIATSRIKIDQVRFIILNAANAVDCGDTKTALKEISEAKISTFRSVLQVIDRAMQTHGAEGMDKRYPMSFFWSMNRCFRYTDGPDEVHIAQLGKLELRRAPVARERDERRRQRSEAVCQKYGIRSHL